MKLPVANGRRELIAPTKRKRMSRARRVTIFLASNGLCHICSQQIRDGEKWDVSHVVPLNLGGADDDSNMRPAHKHCHVEQTAIDKADIAARNQAVDHGYTGKPKPQSPYRRKVDGTVVWRVTGQPVSKR